jgi:23S rRNA (cytosine1962-C5)-methyltransferase
MDDHSTRRVILKQGKATPFLYRHPWVFSGAVKSVQGDIADGDTVALCGYEGDFIAWGLYNSNSQIRVRLYSWDLETVPDNEFFQGLIRRAVSLRHDTLKLHEITDACRLVFSEGDGISGLTVDRYGRYLVLQVHSLALMGRIDPLVRILSELENPDGIILKNDSEIIKKEGIDIEEACLRGNVPDGAVRIREHGILYDIPLQSGQKTGFYLDQRDNRQAAASFCAGKDVLDLCCYSGGFSLNAMKSGAMSVTGVDVSSDAISLAENNARINDMSRISLIREDMFRYLAQLPVQKRYDVIILDPPRFASSHAGIEQAIKGYVRLNRAAMKVLTPGGILVSCSCSGRVGEERFAGAVLEAAHGTGRDLQVLEFRSQAPDHPVSVHCPESRYLKCLVCRVT